MNRDRTRRTRAAPMTLLLEVEPSWHLLLNGDSWNVEHDSKGKYLACCHSSSFQGLNVQLRVVLTCSYISRMEVTTLLSLNEMYKDRAVEIAGLHHTNSQLLTNSSHLFIRQCLISLKMVSTASLWGPILPPSSMAKMYLVDTPSTAIHPQ